MRRPSPTKRRSAASRRQGSATHRSKSRINSPLRMTGRSCRRRRDRSRPLSMRSHSGECRAAALSSRCSRRARRASSPSGPAREASATSAATELHSHGSSAGGAPWENVPWFPGAESARGRFGCVEPVMVPPGRSACRVTPAVASLTPGTGSRLTCVNVPAPAQPPRTICRIFAAFSPRAVSCICGRYCACSWRPSAITCW